MNLIETQSAIKYLKDKFEDLLSKKLNLVRVSAPLFVKKDTGLNDNLNGVEETVSFSINGETIEIVQSLAKWKRYALGKYNFPKDTGLYTDMNAIRKDEEVDFIHSIYVDQWDWEMIITEDQRNYEFLQKIVRKIYSAIYKLEEHISAKYPSLERKLPDDIKFVSTKELEELYPNLSRKEREDAITRKYKAVFLYQIGWKLNDGLPHDGRAADYDDWNLNGDILVYYELYDMALELSSMGIRVNKDSLVKQLKEKGELSKLDNEYCQDIINDRIPLTIGGGIGQSRLCMYMLKKAHIGEVQVSIWDEKETEELRNRGIQIL